jgi:hypothetical protein
MISAGMLALEANPSKHPPSVRGRMFSDIRKQRGEKSTQEESQDSPKEKQLIRVYDKSLGKAGNGGARDGKRKVPLTFPRIVAIAPPWRRNDDENAGHGKYRPRHRGDSIGVRIEACCEKSKKRLNDQRRGLREENEHGCRPDWGRFVRGPEVHRQAVIVRMAVVFTRRLLRVANDKQAREGAKEGYEKKDRPISDAIGKRAPHERTDDRAAG